MTLASALDPSQGGAERGSQHGGSPDFLEVEAGLGERDRLLGDPFGYRSGMEEVGVSFDASLIVDLSRNLSGGAGRAGTFRHLFDASLTFDLNTLAGIEGATVFLDFQTQEGQDGSGETGDLQAFSNIDEADVTALYEFWYEQVFADGAFRVKLGKVDANSEFAFVEHGGEFIHSSAGFSPTLFVLPTYPDPALSASLHALLGEGWSVSAGLYDGAAQEGVRTGRRGFGSAFGSPADLFLIAEVSRAWGDGDAVAAGEVLPGRVAAGVWYHTGAFDRFDGGVASGTGGFYLTADQLLVDLGEGRGVGAFFQYGYADDDVSEVAHHLGAGVQWYGPVVSRPDDVAGVMVSWAGLSGEPGAGFSESDETAVELFYKAQLTPWLSLKPDVQYIVGPGGGGLDDAWVFTLRMELTF
ncbi:MAG: carbohydrate porin [Phycisphaerales bacterium JB063]